MAVKTYQDSKDKYLKEKVDTFVLRVPKGKKDEIMEYAKKRGMSLNGYITELIFADMGEQKPMTAKTPAAKKTTQKPKVQSTTVQKEKDKKSETKKNMPSFLL